MPSTKSTCQRPPTPLYFFDGYFIFFVGVLFLFFVLLFATPLSYHIKCEFKIYTKHLHALGLIKHYAPVTLHTSWATKTIEAQQFNPTRSPALLLRGAMQIGTRLCGSGNGWSSLGCLWSLTSWQPERTFFSDVPCVANVAFMVIASRGCRVRIHVAIIVVLFVVVVVVVAAFDLDNSALFEFSCSLSLSFPSFSFFCFWKYFAVTICIFLIFAPQWNRMRWKCAAKVTLEFHVLLPNPVNSSKFFYSSKLKLKTNEKC